MLRILRRFMPVAALFLATLIGGCVVVPEHHGWHEGRGWGWHRGY